MSTARTEFRFLDLAADAVALLMRNVGWMALVWGPVLHLGQILLLPPPGVAIPDTVPGLLAIWLAGVVPILLVGLLLLWLSSGILDRSFGRAVLAAVLLALFAAGVLAAAFGLDWSDLSRRIAAALWAFMMLAFGAILTWRAARHRRTGGDRGDR